jgi:outer membrane protease
MSTAAMRVLAASLLAYAASSAGAVAQSFSHASADGSLRAGASLGVIAIEGNEKVLVGNYTLSHLIWQSTAPVLSGSLELLYGRL